MARFGRLARDTGLWLSLGGVPEASAQPGRRYNTHYVISADGAVTASYRKVHLFDVDIPGRVTLRESNVTLPGDALVTADSPVGRLGVTVCYDVRLLRVRAWRCAFAAPAHALTQALPRQLRFPAVYESLVFGAGAQVLLIPAAFTRPTGEAHWETLLRARAIETQAYVAAAAQAGRHNDKRESHGHALIIDPWGTVVARCADPNVEDLAVAEVDAEWLATVRQRMPVASHRRLDVYGAA
jgi:predicted amidohydrolase